VEPSGTGLIQDFHRAGGVPALLGLLSGHLELDAITVTGRTWASELPAHSEATGALRDPGHPLHEDGAFAVVRGNLAPDGAVLKTSAASANLFQHTGPAVVFRSYDDMRTRIDDPGLEVGADSVLVLLGAGPVAVPGMPEWGMIPIPAKLAAAGVKDMVRVTDARMSGTSFGTCFLHVAPEAAVGGPLALVRDGDQIRVDVTARRLDLLVDPDELAARKAAWSPPVSEHLRGWPALYQAHVTQADTGCDLDFLQAPDQAHRRFVSPIVGRS
jgi:dihydroxy-acid dehydratase